MKLSTLKATIELMGIRNLSITFDTSHRQIIARFGYAGKAYEKVIKFSEVEQIFTNDKPT